MVDLTDTAVHQQPPPPPSRQVPFREDCWTEEATSTLVDAWGRRYLELNRGNLRQKDWQEIADAVNDRHGHTKKTRRTDVQCKNRIDTLKKKYKVEKAKIVESNGTLASSWPFFSRLDHLIGSNPSKQHHHHGKVAPSVSPVQSSPSPVALCLPPPPMAVPLAYRKPSPHPQMFTPMILPQKRPAPVAMDESYFRRNYSAMAAAAAAAPDEDEGDDDDEDDDVESVGEEARGSENRGVDVEDGKDDGMKSLAKAIERFADIYEKVEYKKMRQTVELEKQKMQFAKDLEVQRMQMFVDTQVRFEKFKRAKRSGSSDDIYS